MAALSWPLEVAREVRFAVPVPLAPVRRRQRGYNQAALLATEIARRRGWICADQVLERTGSLSTQTILHPEERRANVARAFRVRPRALDTVGGEHLLLVDDVWTTGATALACAEALLTAGARAVSVVTLARALPDLAQLDRRLSALANLQHSE
jgi:ComF family protein